jgi:hypothetical protein
MSYYNKLGLLDHSGTETELETVFPIAENDIDKLVRHIKSGSIAEFKKEAADKKIDWDAPATGGWTCLHYATYMGRSQIVLELLNT